VSPDVDRGAEDIIRNVREGGDAALRSLRAVHDRVEPNEPLISSRGALLDARDELAEAERALLERTAERIARFAQAQRNCLRDLDTEVDGGRAGHAFAPVDSAGCYAPGGRYPLVSSVLMTAVTARVAGVNEICVASPSALPIMRAAAAIAGATSFLACGGAHAIAALAYGTESVDPVDVIVGPGNLWVTAAKQQVSGHVGIDMLAGPSELVVVADESAKPEVVAADLLAQAEHDPEARVVLLTTSPALVSAVRDAASEQLATLATRGVAESSWKHAALITCDDEDQLVAACNRLAPEHLHINMPTAKAHRLAERIRHYGALFVGPASAEVLGDYGAGPNHVLPTGRTSRFRGGLSVLTFLRMRTWLEMSGDASVTADARALANLEGLAAHEHAAALRTLD
jgi:histidinol dehydrogenase